MDAFFQEGKMALTSAVTFWYISGKKKKKTMIQNETYGNLGTH
jgi:hypothetical protein